MQVSSIYVSDPRSNQTSPEGNFEGIFPKERGTLPEVSGLMEHIRSREAADFARLGQHDTPGM